MLPLLPSGLLVFCPWLGIVPDQPLPFFPSPHVCMYVLPPAIVRELSALHTKRLMVTFDESEAERERDVEDATREVSSSTIPAPPQSSGFIIIHTTI